MTGFPIRRWSRSKGRREVRSLDEVCGMCWQRCQRSRTQQNVELALQTSLEIAGRLPRSVFCTTPLVRQGSRRSRAEGEVSPAHVQVLAVPTLPNFDSGAS